MTLAIDIPASTGKAERNGALRESRLEPALVRREIAEALRRVWTFPGAPDA